MALYIESLILVETLSPNAVFLSPSGYVGTLVKSLQFLSWILWYCNLGDPASWSSFHFCFAAVFHSTFSVAHLSIGLI